MVTITKDDMVMAFSGLQKIARLDRDPGALDLHVDLANHEVYKELKERGIEITDETVIDDNDVLKDTIVAFAIYRYLFDTQITSANLSIKDKTTYWEKRYSSKLNAFINAYNDRPVLHTRRVVFVG